METAAAPSVSGTKAGFWIRLVAYIIDVLIFGIPAQILSALFGLSKQGYPTSNLIAIVFFVVYFTYLFSASSFMGPGQTIGMRVLNLRVISTSGGSLDMTKALIRALVLAAEVFTVIGLLGCIWAAFDPNKQAVHDKAAGTYVVKA